MSYDIAVPLSKTNASLIHLPNPIANASVMEIDDTSSRGSLSLSLPLYQWITRKHTDSQTIRNVKNYNTHLGTSPGSIMTKLFVKNTAETCSQATKRLLN